MSRFIPSTRGNLQSTKNVIDKFFDDFFTGDLLNDMSINKMSAMKVDVLDKEDHYEVIADLPGYTKEDIELEVIDNNLVLTATKKDEVEENDINYIRRERFFGEVKRSFQLDHIDRESIEAKFENGVLIIQLKKNPDQSKVIEVKWKSKFQKKSV